MLGILFNFFALPLFTFWYLLRLTYRPCNSKVSMVGKTAVITGGNKGIGFQVSLGLAARGCKVIIGCRSKAEKERENIIKLTHNPNVIVKFLDLNLLASVRKFAKEIDSSEDKIDVLINNAGIGASEKLISDDNLNSVMQTNYFGHFLLTHLLIKLLKKSQNGRIIFTSSIGTLVNNLTVENLNVLEEIPPTVKAAAKQYSNSKTCLLIASNIFAKKLKKLGITSNAVSPAFVYTNIFQSTSELLNVKPALISLFYFLVYIFFKSPEEGAQAILRVAISNTYKDVTGTFAWDFKHHYAPKCSRNKQFCQQIWNHTEKLVKLSENEKL